jgi:hypothetical protein
MGSSNLPVTGGIIKRTAKEILNPSLITVAAT